MARHDVYRNLAGEGFLLDVQADLLGVLNTRAVVPLLPIGRAPKPAARLNPVFTTGDEEAVMITQFISAVPVGILGDRLASLSNQHDAIVIALDMLFQGFQSEASSAEADKGSAGCSLSCAWSSRSLRWDGLGQVVFLVQAHPLGLGELAVEPRLLLGAGT